MVAEDRYCVDVLLQIAAVRAALDSAGKLLLAAHVESCVSDAVASGRPRERQQKLDELIEVFGRFGAVGRLKRCGRGVPRPVCGMACAPTARIGSSTRADFRFCNPRCLERFRADPAAFLAPQAPAQAEPGRRYTCPMHPEVVRDGPGSCPICGMALEPMDVAAEEEESAELVDMRRRFVVERRAHAAALRARDGGDVAAARATAARGGLDPARARDAGRAVGRLALLRARLGLARERGASTCSR